MRTGHSNPQHVVFQDQEYCAPVYRTPSDTLTLHKLEVVKGAKMNSNNFKQIFAVGKENNTYAKYFTGKSYLAPLANGDVNVANVTFEPACRNHWHIHHGFGQILICTAGKGWYQEAKKPAQPLQAGDVVNIPNGIKHWHGATKDTWFSHLSVTVQKENTRTEWLEPVTDNEYDAL